MSPDPSPRPAPSGPRRAAWLGRWPARVLVAAVVLGAQLGLSVGSLDSRYRARLALPEGGLEVAPGSTITLPLGDLPAASARYLLVLRADPRGAAGQLTIGGTPDTARQRPHRQDGASVHFDVDRARLPTGALAVRNGGEAPARLTKAEIRNFTAGYSVVGRFAQFFEPSGRVAHSWPVTLALLAGGLTLQLGAVAWLGRGPATAPAGWRPWLPLGGPLLGLGAWLAVRADGRFLVLGWDAFLLLAGAVLMAKLLVVASARAWALAVAAYRSPRRRTAVAAALDLLPAAFPALVLFLYLPLSIYLPNQAGFNHHLPVLLPFLLAAAAWGALVWLLRRLRPRWFDRAVKGLFVLGLYVLMADLVTPVEFAPLDGGPVAEKLTVPRGATAIQVGLLVVLAALAATVAWERVRALAQYVALTLLLTQVVTFAVEISPNTHYSYGVDSRAAASHPAPAQASPGGNVYQIVLDAFSSQVLPAILEDPALARQFDGFVFYARNRANMLHTTESIPSFMTGSFFPPKGPGQSDRAWWSRTVHAWRRDCTTGGILEEAYLRGYTITQYVPTLKWCPHARHTHLRLGLDVQRGNKALAGFADLWLLKVTPAAWKTSLFGDGTTGVLERLLDEPGDTEWGYWSIAHMAQLVRDEAGRPDHGQYVWAHFGTPHPPSVVDAQCRYVGNRWYRDWAGGYRDQATCAIRLVGTLIDELRRLGRLDRATIIVQSDHAVRSVDPLSRDDEMPAWLVQRLGREAARFVNNRSLALLLVKRPGARPGRMEVDRRPVSLVDLAQTVYDMQGWPARTPEGCSLLRQDLPGRRDRHLFVHLVRDLPPEARRDWHLVSDGLDWQVVTPYPPERAPAGAGAPSADGPAPGASTVCPPAR